MKSKVKRTVSITTLRDYLDCRRAGRMREFWAPYQFQPALAYGSAIHAGLEALYLVWPDLDAGKLAGEQAITKYFSDDLLTQLGHLASSSMHEINAMYTEVWGVFQNYIAYEKRSPLIPKGSKILWVEKRMQAPAIEGLALSGQIDLAYVTPSNELVVVDHKTSGKGLDQASLDVDEQLTGYAYLARSQSGVTPSSVVYNVIMKSVPQPPNVLTKGGLSVAKEQATTPDLFRHALVSLGLEMTPKYEEYIQFLEENGWARFFKREESRRTDLELDHFGEYMKVKVRDIAESLSGPWDLAYPAPSIYRCGYCPFIGPCKSMMSGEDWEAVLNSKFKSL